MAFDKTNTLELSEVNNGDIDWYDGGGIIQGNLVAHTGTTGGFWYCNPDPPGTTPSGSTGCDTYGAPGSNDSFAYAEMSGSPSAYEYVGFWTTSYNNNNQNLFVEIDYYLYALLGATLYVEYSLLASPDPTDNADWTVADSVAANGTDPGVWNTLQVDLSAISKSSTVWIRIRYLPPSNNYANDGCFGNWRIYGVDTQTYKLEGVTKDKNGSVLGSCKCFLWKDNLDNTLTFVGYALSDAVTGAYSFTGITDNDAQYIVESWKDDTPHVFDMTDHVLQPIVE